MDHIYYFKFVKGTQCHLAIGFVNNIVAVVTIFDDDVECPTIKVMIDIVVEKIWLNQFL